MIPEQAKEFFIKIETDTETKEELAGRLWDKMTKKEKEPYIRELKELRE